MIEYVIENNFSELLPLRSGLHKDDTIIFKPLNNNCKYFYIPLAWGFELGNIKKIIIEKPLIAVINSDFVNNPSSINEIIGSFIIISHISTWQDLIKNKHNN